ncbi:MAG: TonB-dependent receptor [Pseudomonadota bacterium]|nr:TonB-dependent receptor [Pseudomonadota bacterium]
MVSSKNCRSGLLVTCALVQVVAHAGEAEPGQQPNLEEVVVSSQRVGGSGDSALKPVTVLAADKLLNTTPSSVSDALKSTPQFQTDPAARNTSADARGNPVGNYLDLRLFGPSRTLVLVDGLRLPPTSSNGAINTNIIPQSLVKRVDVVMTGGASAAYGSDAITGVVNFVLDHDYTGLKFNVQSGVSNYGDNESYKVGAAFGTPVLDNRAHFLLSLEHYDAKGIEEPSHRPEQGHYYITAGTGLSPDSPFRLIPDGRTTFNGFGGVIVGPDPFTDTIFKVNGVPSPLMHGLPTGVSTLEQGGDYGTNYGLDLLAPIKTNQVFSRFEVDVTDTVTGHLQFSYNDGSSNINYIPLMMGFFPPLNIKSGNPFIPASIQQTMTDTNTPLLQMMKTNQFGDGYPTWRTEAFSKNIFWNAGLEGDLFGDFKWKLDYVYDQSSERVTNPNNISTAKLAAALDAVVDPATGQVVCATSLTPSAALFPGCQPLNLFGPTAASMEAIRYIIDPTSYTLKYLSNDATLAITGSPFSLPAGPLNVALTGEYRSLRLRQTVLNGDATQFADCTGLDQTNCPPQSLQYISETLGPANASVNTREVAAEFLVPVLRDVPMVQSLDLNLAGRITDYSTIGTVETWKLGATWQIYDDLRLRGTLSKDIRAPTLMDLFGPRFLTNGQVTDLHTGETTLSPLASAPNRDLVPEVARTVTYGFVYEPSFIPRFSLAVDYYRINMTNAIVNVTGSDVLLQQQCETSNGTSPYCALLKRRLPFSDRSPDNYVTQIVSGPGNAYRQWTHGIDVEANYSFDAASIISSAPGTISARTLVAYQPLLRTQIAPSVPYIEYAGIAVAGNAGATSSGNAGNGFSKVRVNVNLGYTYNDFNIEIAERIQSGVHVTDPRLYYDTRPDISTYYYTDLSISNDFDVGSLKLTPFLSAQNLFNNRPPIIGAMSLQAGIIPTPVGYDVIGRYVTIGVRGEF